MMGWLVVVGARVGGEVEGIGGWGYIRWGTED